MHYILMERSMDPVYEKPIFVSTEESQASDARDVMCGRLASAANARRNKAFTAGHKFAGLTQPKEFYHLFNVLKVPDNLPEVYV